MCEYRHPCLHLLRLHLHLHHSLFFLHLHHSLLFLILQWMNPFACSNSKRRRLQRFAEDEETDDEDSFFDLVLKSPESVAVTRRGVPAEKDFRFIESPRNVFVRGNGFVNSRPLCKITLVRSTPKLVFMLGFRKSSKCERSKSNGEAKRSLLNQFPKSTKIEESNRLAVACRVEKTPGTCRVVGVNDLRSQLLKETFNNENSPEKSSRGLLPKYLKLIRPLYLMVWRRQHDKTKPTGSSTPSVSPMTVTANFSSKRITDGSRIGSFKITARRFGKSRSVSTAVGMSPQPAHRRDDSLLERDDGIQNAVLYCKRSYNSSSKEFSKLFQSSIDPLHHGSSREEPTRCSV